MQINSFSMLSGWPRLVEARQVVQAMLNDVVSDIKFNGMSKMACQTVVVHSKSYLTSTHEIGNVDRPLLVLCHDIYTSIAGLSLGASRPGLCHLDWQTWPN